MDVIRETQTEPTPAPETDGTPTQDPAAALHFAAVAIGLAEARETQGHYLTTEEQAVFHRYQNAARSHGFTEQQVRCYLDTELRPALALPRPDEEFESFDFEFGDRNK